MSKFMLGFLACFSLSAANIKLVKPKVSGKYAFDIVYTDANGQEVSTTNGKGYYVAFRQIKNKQPQAWKYLNDMTTLGGYFQEYQVMVQGENKATDGSIDVIFSIFENNKNVQWDFDLAVFCDADYDTEGDNVKLLKKFNGKGVTFDSKTRPMSIILKDTLIDTELTDESSNVDSIYTGAAPSDGSAITEYEKLMLTNNFPDSTQAGQDSALAFAWTNRKQKPTRRRRLGFRVVVGSSFSNTPPSILDVTNDKNVQKDFDLTFTVTELDAQEVTVYVKHRTALFPTETFETQECGKFTSDGKSKITGNVTCRRSFGTDTQYTYSAFVRDPSGAESKPTTQKQLILDGSVRPSLSVLQELPKEIYAKDKYISVPIRFDDDKAVKISYGFDGVTEFTSDLVDTSDEGPKSVLFHVRFPSSLKLNGWHKLEIWATDENNQDSLHFEHYFSYSAPNKPSISEIYLSEEKVVKDNITKLVVYGQATDPDKDDEIRIFAEIEGETPKQVASAHSAGTTVVPFAGFFYFPSKPVGRYNIKFYAMDSNHTSEENYTLMMIVWDPEAKQIPDTIGKITDASNELSSDSNALFNLKYEDPDGFPRQMTFNNEGFFCSFITFNDTSKGSRLGQYYYKKSDPFYFRKDDFRLFKQIVKNTYTNFLEVKISVRNERYFPRRFDLSLFADSDLNGDDNGLISNREDGRGLVIKSEKYNLRYTVFTQDYYDYPAATFKYITNDFKRSGDLPLNSMPFFNQTASESMSANSNSAYGVSWISQEIPGETEVVFTLAFAAYDKVKSPPRLVDQTEWKDSYLPTEEAEIKLAVRDNDEGEILELRITENYVNKSTDSWIVRQDSKLFTKKMNFSSELRYYIVSVDAVEKDELTRFPSNRISKRVSLSGKPTLTVDQSQFKSFYHNRENFTIKGSVTDDNAEKISICYKFVRQDDTNKFVVGAERCLDSFAITAGRPNNFEVNVSFTEIYPAESMWKIIFYANDRDAYSDSITHQFTYNVYSPPTLIKAGLSKKSAPRNAKILAYCIYNDQQNDLIEVYIKSGKGEFEKSPVFTSSTNPAPGEDYPIAFYYIVPSDAELGSMDVTFMVKDSEGLESNTITKTLVVTGN